MTTTHNPFPPTDDHAPVRITEANHLAPSATKSDADVAAVTTKYSPDPGAAVLARRTGLGLSRVKFGRLCRIDPATVMKIENCGGKPDWETLCKLVEFAGIHPQDLIGFRGTVDLAAVGLAPERNS